MAALAKRMNRGDAVDHPTGKVAAASGENTNPLVGYKADDRPSREAGTVAGFTTVRSVRPGEQIEPAAHL